MAAVAVFLMAWCALVAARGTQIGDALHRHMVVEPATAANGLRRIDVALVLAVMLMIGLHVMAGGADPVRLLALAAPDLTLWLASVEFGAIVEAAAALAVALSGWRAARRSRPSDTRRSADGDRRFSPARRARRSRRVVRRPAANDDGDGVPVALAG